MMPTYILRNKDIAQRMVNYVKAVAGPAAAANRPVVVEISEYDEKRSSDQNRLLWQVLTDISEQVVVDGRRFTKEGWYGHYLELFAPKEDSPRGLVPVGSSQMKKRQCAEFITKIQADAAQEYGVEFAAI